MLGVDCFFSAQTLHCNEKKLVSSHVVRERQIVFSTIFQMCVLFSSAQFCLWVFTSRVFSPPKHILGHNNGTTQEFSSRIFWQLF